MPALMVSVVICDGSGFSMKRVTRPAGVGLHQAVGRGVGHGGEDEGGGGARARGARATTAGEVHVGEHVAVEDDR